MKNHVKITSGSFRGRTIVTPGEGTHPMGERERLALFNMILEDLPDARVLDAYAGSGALGIEALSRGAREVVFVEANRKAADCIRSNLATLEIISCQVICTKVQNYETEAKFDVILVDPPYDNFVLSEVEHLAPMLKASGIMVLSHPGDLPSFSSLKPIKSRKYAGATISILTKG